MSAVAFVFALLTLLSACGVVAAKQPLHSALFLTLTLFLVAVLYALIGAHFVAAIQVLVYAGAIMVLVVFVIMLLGLESNAPLEGTRSGKIFATIAAGALFILLGMVITEGLGQLAAAKSAGPVAAVDGSTQAVGKMLFTEHLFAFEVTSVLILAAIIGSVVLGFESKRALRPGRGLKTRREAIEQSFAKKSGVK